eukprot:971558_1
MNAFAESVSESDIRHSQSQHESDPNQYQYPHSVIEQSGTSEQYITYTHHQYINCEAIRNKVSAISPSTQPISSAKNSATQQQLQSTINQLQRVQTAHKMLQKDCVKIEQL